MKKQPTKTTIKVSTDIFLANMPENIVPKLRILTNALQGGSYLQKKNDIFLVEVKLADTEIDSAEMYHLFCKLEDADFIQLYAYKRYNQENIMTNKDEDGKMWIRHVIEAKLARGEKEFGLLVKAKLQKKFFDLAKELNLRESVTKKQHANTRQQHILTRDKKGNYTIAGKIIVISKHQLYYKVFDGAYQSRNHQDFAPYEKIESYLIKYGEKTTNDIAKRNKRIQNALGPSYGFFKKARYENEEPVKNERPGDSTTQLLEIVHGGVQFNIVS